MNRFLGGIRWNKKAVIFFLIIFILVFLSYLTQHYLSGKIELNSDLVQRISDVQMKEKWEILVSQGYTANHTIPGSIAPTMHFVPSAPKDNTVVPLWLGYAPGSDDNTTIDLVQIYLYDQETDKNLPETIAWYERPTLAWIMNGNKSFGECSSQVHVITSDCVISMMDYDDSDASAQEFNKMLEKILLFCE